MLILIPTLYLPTSQSCKFKFSTPRDSICEAPRTAFSEHDGEFFGHPFDHTDQRLRFDVANGCAGTRTRTVYDDNISKITNGR